LNGVPPPLPPDPTEPQRSADALARLKLTQALERAKYAIAWERSWPHLARLLTVIGLFLVASWAGLWLVLPSLARAIGLVLFLLLALAAALPLVWFRWPSREQGLSRLDHGSGVAHRPATTLTDTLSTQDPVALALWQAQRERTLASLKRIRAGLPSPRLRFYDPWALRGLVLVMLVAAFFAAGDERTLRVLSAFDWNGVLAPTNIRVDAWVNPPAYTGKPPIILSAANKEAAALPMSGPLAVPTGSTLIVRSSGGALDVIAGGGVTEAVPTEEAPKGTNEKRFTIAGDGTVHVRAPSGQPQWKFTATPDRAPTIALAKDPERQARGSLQMAYKIEDDYGVTEARAQFADRPAEGRQGPAARPLFNPPQFPLVLPNARTRNGVGQTVKDLSEDPYAGADVTLQLMAKDEAGNEGKSEPFNMRLPERLFANSLARALIEQRRILALDANKNSEVFAALDALMIAPELFTPDAGCYLGLRSLALQLEAARTDDQLRDVVASMWTFAVTIEDDGVAGNANAALRAAQNALKQAIERGASEEEIKALTRKLREAMAGKVRDLARRSQNQQGPRQPLAPEVQLILDKAVELRDKTTHAKPEQLEELAQQQDALRKQLQDYRKSANGRAGAGDDGANQFTRDRQCGT
jgi:uncharacterized protein (TIGR02302 family)